MKMKKTRLFLVAILCFCMVMTSGILVSCGDKNGGDEGELGDIETLEAEETTQQTEETKPIKYEDFIGSWKANDSARADDMYGGYEITFYEDMTYVATVTGEENEGKCTFEDGFVYLQGPILTQKFTFNELGEMQVMGDGRKILMLRVENPETEETD